MEISDFSKQVIKNIQSIPAGKVATYKQIAELSGKPQGSRGVAWLLHSSSKAHKLPWHRVLNSKGTISFPKKTKGFRDQKKNLEKEGVVVSDDGRLDLKKFQWKKTLSKKKTKAGKPQMFS